MEKMLDKCRWLRENYPGLPSIEVDGGVSAETASLCLRAGANVLVAGSAIYSTGDMHSAIRKIKMCQ